MGFLSKLLRAPAPIDAMRADIFMECDLLSSFGRAAVEWVSLESSDPKLRPLLVALLYARILYAHTETRTQLFEVVDVLSKQNVRDEGHTGFGFPEWPLPAGFGLPGQRIWPWVLCDDPSALRKPKVYHATLQGLPGPATPGQATSGHFGIHLKMASGLERILAPACVLIAITSYAESTDQEGRYELALFLWQVNEFYGSPDRVRIGSESKALAAATTAIKSGDLRAPKN